jgi:DNA-binding NarL/FixJ family response regulator
VIRVLIVDDQDIVRQGMDTILRHEPGIEVAGVAANGQEAITLAETLQPDVVLMDLKMPVMNGIQATRTLCEQFPKSRVLVLTTYDGDEWVFDAIRAGASGYLLKDAASEEIVAAIRGAVAGEVHLDPAIAGKVLAEFNRLTTSSPLRAAPRPANGPAARSGSPAEANELLLEPLTERELAILQEMVQGKTNKEIAETLFLAEGTVKNYVSAIIEKLQANDRTQAAILALKRGLARLE